MRKRSVPYTIVRGGVYYLNLRWNNQFIRQSLATKDPMEAFQKVNQLAPIFSNPKTCEQILRQQVFEMGNSCRYARYSGFRVTERSVIGFQSDFCGCIPIPNSPSGNVNWPMCWV